MDPIHDKPEPEDLHAAEPVLPGDDWELTAYALGELDAESAARIEARLASDPAAQAEVDAIGRLAGQIQQTLGSEASPGLTPDQLAAIKHEALQPPAPLKPATGWPWAYRVGGAIAACAAVGLITLPFLVDRHTQVTPQVGQDAPVAMHERQRLGAESADVAAYRRAAKAAPEVSSTSDAALEQSVAHNAQGGAPQPTTPPPAAVAAPQSLALGESRRESQHDGGVVLGVQPSAAPARDVRRLERTRLAPPPFGVMADTDVDPSALPRRHVGPFHTEGYDAATHNPFMSVAEHPLSTFSLEVDTGSYANLRRWLTQNRRLPTPGAVRIEEMVNYFPYRYAAPKEGDEHPLAVHVETASAPWATAHRLVKVGVKGRQIPHDQRPASNLVFLIDVSGSMMPPNKLPLLRQAMTLLVSQLDGRDRVAIVVYAGAAGLVLDATPAGDEHKAVILSAIDRLQAGGSTHGSAGIRLAYEVAQRHFIPGGVNRVILASDGDFNVGTSSRDELAALIETKRATGVFLTVLGFGQGNYKDAAMEELARKGNGHYAYIDTLGEARKVLIEQAAGTLYTIAKDVKVQVEFNPAKVQSHRLIGYENRLLAKEDFNDDAKDAGEIGAGHTVTALYEIVPVGASDATVRPVDPLKYQSPDRSARQAASEELLTVKLRYKLPASEVSTLLEVPVTDSGASWQEASEDFRFAAAVAQWGMLLRQSPHLGSSSYERVLDLAQGALSYDPQGYRAQFVQLVQQARALSQSHGPSPTPTQPGPARD